MDFVTILPTNFVQYVLFPQYLYSSVCLGEYWFNHNQYLKRTYWKFDGGQTTNITLLIFCLLQIWLCFNHNFKKKSRTRKILNFSTLADSITITLKLFQKYIYTYFFFKGDKRNNGGGGGSKEINGGILFFCSTKKLKVVPNNCGGQKEIFLGWSKKNLERLIFSCPEQL